jgi:vitamin-K-epoxide reductase (warfarin-sensitive)
LFRCWLRNDKGWVFFGKLHRYPGAVGWDAERSLMRFVLALLAVVGIAASALALREHYRTDTSPCSINEKWDCGIVNHSPYAVLWGVPVATIGIAGYLLLGILALKRWYGILLPVSLAGLAFSLYLAHIEAHLLGVWCIYCVASLGVISAISLLVLGTVLSRLRGLGR